jgi:hypothetical protein
MQELVWNAHIPNEAAVYKTDSTQIFTAISPMGLVPCMIPH